LNDFARYFQIAYPMPIHSRQIVTALEKTVFISPLAAPISTKITAAVNTAARSAFSDLSDTNDSA
jgi:hypothetical protein